MDLAKLLRKSKLADIKKEISVLPLEHKRLFKKYTSMKKEDVIELMTKQPSLFEHLLDGREKVVNGIKKVDIKPIVDKEIPKPKSSDEEKLTMYKNELSKLPADTTHFSNHNDINNIKDKINKKITRLSNRVKKNKFNELSSQYHSTLNDFSNNPSKELINREKKLYKELTSTYDTPDNNYMFGNWMTNDKNSNLITDFYNKRKEYISGD